MVKGAFPPPSKKTWQGGQSREGETENLARPSKKGRADQQALSLLKPKK